MVRFAKGRDDIDYVVKCPGEITVDDPVGAYILKRAESSPKAKTNFGGPTIHYKRMLDDFENSDMPKEWYDQIMGRINQLKKPLSVIRDEKVWLQRSREKKKLLRQLFGDVEKLPEDKKAELIYRLGENGGFEDYVKEYALPKIDQIPSEYSNSSNLARTAIQNKDLKDLEKILARLENAVNFYTKERFGNLLNHLENRELRQAYDDAFTYGNVFRIIEVATDIEKRLG
jgi:hypothetical protein